MEIRMKKIKVLMLGWEFPPQMSGGLGVASQGLSEALGNLIDLRLILPPNSSFSPYSEPYGIYGGDLIDRVRRYQETALKESRNYQFDFINAHDWMTFPAALQLKRLTGKPLIVHIHSLNYDRVGPNERGWVFELERQAMSDADRVITVSEYTQSICEHRYGIDPAKIVSIHNGVPPLDSTEAPRSSSEKLVLFLGRMTRQKAPLNFLKIADLVRREIPKVRFVMAGAGDQLDEVISESFRLDLNELIEFPGFVDRETVNTLLAQTDVYCMPSASEPFGISALEAAQFGIPVVMSNRSGAAEVLTHARTADPEDIESMAGHIIELLQDEEAHAVASTHSREDHQPYTWDRAAKLVNEIYEQLASK